MTLLDFNDETFRPVPEGDYNSIWNAAEEVHERITLMILQGLLKAKRLSNDASCTDTR